MSKKTSKHFLTLSLIFLVNFLTIVESKAMNDSQIEYRNYSKKKVTKEESKTEKTGRSGKFTFKLKAPKVDADISFGIDGPKKVIVSEKKTVQSSQEKQSQDDDQFWYTPEGQTLIRQSYGPWTGTGQTIGESKK